MMRRILAFLLVCLLVTCWTAACGSSQPTVPTLVPVNPRVLKTLTVGDYGGEIVAAANRVVTFRGDGQGTLTLTLWDAKTLEPAGSIPLVSPFFDRVAISGDGSSLITVGVSGVNGWSTIDGAHKYELNDERVSSMGWALSPSKDRFVWVTKTVTSDPIAFEIHAAEYDAASGARVLTLQDAGEAAYTVASVRYSTDGKYIAQQLTNGPADAASKIIVWDRATGSIVSRATDDFFGPSKAFDWLDDSSGIVIGSPKGKLRVLDPLTGDTRRMFELDPGILHSLQVSPDGSLTGVLDGEATHVALRVLDTATGREIFQTDVAHPEEHIAFAPDGRLVAVGHRFGAIWGGVDLFDAHSGTQIALLTQDGQALANPTNEQRDAARPAFAEFSPDGRSLIALSELEGRTGVVLTVWDVSR